MRLFPKYLKMHLKGIVAAAAFAAVFAALFYLYKLPLAAVGYATAVCAFLGVVILFMDYRKYAQRYRRLGQVMREIVFSVENLPAPGGGVERQYQEIVRSMHAERQRATGELASRYTDLTDYYTTWVHQIKTPISAMRLLLQSGDDEKSRELLYELGRIEQYVEMVLTYLRLDSDTTDYVIREHDLDDIIKQAVKKYAAQFIRRKIKLDYEETGHRVLTDEKWLLFVIEQILSNALKYTTRGSVTVTVSPPKTLVISDTGIGIAPEDLPRVFEKGYTGCNGHNDKRSSGIGLFLCRRVCNNLGHGLNIESEMGKGTTVRLDLSRAEMLHE